MGGMAGGVLVLVLGLSSAAAGDGGGPQAAAPAGQYQAIVKEYYDLTMAHWRAATDAERNKAFMRVDRLSLRCLDLAENNPKDRVAFDALVMVVMAEDWLERNTLHPGRGADRPQARAVALLLRNHIGSPRLGEACQRAGYAFGKECEALLRGALEQSPHREVRAVACLRLGQFLNGRLQRLDLLKERPELARRYERLFGKDYLAELRRRDRARAVAEVEALFERAAAQYGDVKSPFGGTVRESARSELYEIRHLAVGKQAPDTAGEDQDGRRFQLSDYRGKVVLLYFWSEY